MNKDILKAAWYQNNLAATLIAMFGTATLFFDSLFSDDIKIILGIIFLGIGSISFLFNLYKVSTLKSVILNKNSSKVEIKFGNIFDESSDTFKVISFNEYFDTIVDDEIIAETSLNGRYLREKCRDIEVLNKKIVEDQHLKTKEVATTKRKRGNHVNYELGSILKNEDYLLVAFSKFTENNKAELTQDEFITSLLNMWKEIDIFKAGKSVAIPLLGSNMLRIKNNIDISNQEILEMILLTFELSKIKMGLTAKLKIILHESVKNDIELYKFK